jgi:DUF4097 and DUF4098 domain-containing protein YvlB
MRILAASALVLTLAAPQAAVAAQKETETIDRTVSIGPRGTLKLKNFSGDIRITGASGNDVVIHAVRRATRERLDNIKLDVTTSGSTVSIEANKRDSNWRDRNNNVVETDFEITVPQGTTLDLDSFSGKVDVRGVTGSIEAKTFSGNIEIDVAQAAQVPALTAETFSGDINARVPASASGRVRFNSFSGSVSSDLPISMGGRSRSRDVDADLGTGSGPTLRFKTFSGDLRILK